MAAAGNVAAPRSSQPVKGGPVTCSRSRTSASRSCGAITSATKTGGGSCTWTSSRSSFPPPLRRTASGPNRTGSQFSFLTATSRHAVGTGVPSVSQWIGTRPAGVRQHRRAAVGRLLESSTRSSGRAAAVRVGGSCGRSGEGRAAAWPGALPGVAAVRGCAGPGAGAGNSSRGDELTASSSNPTAQSTATRATRFT